MQDAGAPARGEAGEVACALFLDFDGTLVDIAARPEAVVVEPGLADALARLRDGLGGALAIVTGRPIAVIDGFLGPHAFDAAGLHGAESRVAGRLSPCRAEDHPGLRRALETVRERLAGEPGLLIEDKGCTLALHWRLAPEAGARALRLMEEIAAGLGGEYRLQHGKAVAELLPARAAKGAAIKRLLESPPFQGRRPVFVGDDLTDEQGFEFVNASGGVSVRVGDGPTRAGLRVGTPSLLRRWLDHCAQQGRLDFEAGHLAA